MNKKFMLAAVMGCTMALGFTGCSDDDGTYEYLKSLGIKEI